MSLEEDIYVQKEVAFYSETLNAWYVTKFEKDKHLMSLSSIAIGFLVTLATTVGTDTKLTMLVYLLSVVSFLISILSVLLIFTRNSKYLEKIILNEESDNDSILDILDKSAMLSFVFGIIFMLFVGGFSIRENIKNEERVVNNKVEKMVANNTSVEKKSLNGAQSMRPARPQPAQSSNTQKSSENKQNPSSE